MFHWLKKHFIPHDENDHQPHFLRNECIRVLLIIILIVELGMFLMPYVPVLNPLNFTSSILPSVLDDLTNQNRREQNLSELKVNSLLNKAAELKAQDMAVKNYFAHTSPEGKSPWYWFEKVGYKFEYAGENLAMDFTDSQDVADGWMNSPTHRANIVKNAYTEMGTGIATGTFLGKPTIFIAQVYAKPASVVAVMPSTDNLTIETKSSSKVLGAEVGASESISTRTPPRAISIDESQPPREYIKTNIFQKYATSPRHIANMLFGLIGALVAVAVLLKIFIRMDKRHPVLITNGLLVLALIFGVYAINDYTARAKVSEFVSFQGFEAGDAR